MAKRSTRRMRGGFLEGIISLFTGEKKPANSTVVATPTPPSNVVVVNPQNVGEKVVPGATAPMNLAGKVPTAFGGSRKSRRTRRRCVAPRKSRRSARRASRKSRRSHRSRRH